jgi:hypothetical protein
MAPARVPIDIDQASAQMTPGDRTILRQRLDMVLSGRLRPDVAAIGSRIMARLETPVKVMVIGRQGVGKSLLCNLLSRQSDFADCVFSELLIPTGGADGFDALHQADIALWCGQKFGAADLAIWSGVPDSLKDHSYFVLTKADTLAVQGQLQSTLAAVGDAAADDFLGVFPVATLRAETESHPDATQAGPAFRSSGAAALVAAISRQLAQARGALRDGALVFLDRYEPISQVAKVTGQDDQPSPWGLPFAYLQERAQELAAVQSLDDTEKVRQVIDHCCATADGLADLVSAVPTLSDLQPALVQEMMTVSDMMILMQQEGDVQSAIDAMALLLQLRRDIAMWAVS